MSRHVDICKIGKNSLTKHLSKSQSNLVVHLIRKIQVYHCLKKYCVTIKIFEEHENQI